MRYEHVAISMDRILSKSVLSPMGLIAELPIGVIAVSHEKIGHPAVVFFENPLGAEQPHVAGFA